MLHFSLLWLWTIFIVYTDVFNLFWWHACITPLSKIAKFSLWLLSMPLCNVTLQDFLQEAEPLPQSLHLGCSCFDSRMWQECCCIGSEPPSPHALHASFPSQDPHNPCCASHGLACCVLTGTCCCPQNLRSELLIDWKLTTDALPKQAENRSADAQNY